MAKKKMLCTIMLIFHGLVLLALMSLTTLIALMALMALMAIMILVDLEEGRDGATSQEKGVKELKGGVAITQAIKISPNFQFL